MLQYISKDFFSQFPVQITDTLIRTSGQYIRYEQSPETANEIFTVGVMIELINRHLFEQFHIRDISLTRGVWRVDTSTFHTEDTELAIALWKALVYCYDEEKRNKEIEEKEKIWRQLDDELVTTRSR